MEPASADAGESGAVGAPVVGSIHSAVRHGRLGEVEALLVACDVDEKDAYGNTPLHIACQNGHFDLAHLLLARQASLNVRNDTGNTPLHYAFGFKYIELGEFLRGKGADDRILNGRGESCYTIFAQEQLKGPVA